MEKMVIENGIYYPEHACIFDSNGNRIRESCIINGRTRIKYNPPKHVDQPTKYIDKTVIYAGALYGPFGHMLTEGMSRLWYTLETTEPIIFHFNRPDDPYVIECLRIAGIYNRFFNPGAARFKKIIIPGATFWNGNWADPRHKLFFEAAARNVVTSTDTIADTLYLSRRKLPPNLRKIINEEDLEYGHVIFPEELPIRKQIELINRYDHIAGCYGSQMHGLLFRINPVKSIKLFCMNNHDVSCTNYRLVDEIKGFNTEYVEILRRVIGCTKPHSKRDFYALV